MILLDKNLLQTARCACQKDQPTIVSALRLDTGRQHSAHTVADDEHLMRINPGVLTQKCRGQKRVLDGFFLYRNRQGFIPQQLDGMGKGALIVANGCDSVGGQAVSQIPEGSQLAHLFIHIAGARAMDEHHSRHGLRCLGGQCQASLQRILRTLSHDDFFFDHISHPPSPSKNRKAPSFPPHPPGRSQGFCHPSGSPRRRRRKRTNNGCNSQTPRCGTSP